MKGLTHRQHEIFDWICIFRIENRFSPSVKEIGVAFGLSVPSAWSHFNALAKKGYIKVQPDRPRSLRIRKLASIYHGTVGDLFLQVAPKGTAKMRSEIQNAQ